MAHRNKLATICTTKRTRVVVSTYANCGIERKPPNDFFVELKYSSSSIICNLTTMRKLCNFGTGDKQLLAVGPMRSIRS